MTYVNSEANIVSDGTKFHIGQVLLSVVEMPIFPIPEGGSLFFVNIFVYFDTQIWQPPYFW